MSIINSLQLQLIENHQLPDHYESISNYLNADENFVISRAIDGAAISTYKDMVWNLKMYDAKGRCIYNFAGGIPHLTHPKAYSIIAEMKIVQLARLYLYYKPRKPGSISLIQLNKLANLALKNDLSLNSLFEDENTRRLIIPSYAELAAAPMRDMLFFFKELFDLRTTHADFKFSPTDYSTIELMQEIYDRYPKAQKNDPQQTKLIPSRLYAAIICSFKLELDDFIDNADAIINLHKDRKNSPLFGLPTTRAKRNKASTKWSDAVACYHLDSLFNKLSIYNWIDLSSYLGEVQCIAKYWIHLFSGMRSNEARHLPADTYTTIKASGAEVTIIRGYTSKIKAQNNTQTFWVTSVIAEKGIIAARKIGRISAIMFDYDDKCLSSYPLFPALKKVCSEIQAFKGGPVVAEASQGRALKRVMGRSPDLIVQEGDVHELEQFDGFRDWRADPDVKIGEVWPLTTHQCRRSLAVYCARSGLVSVGSSALQFKQLTEAMASYYRAGSAFAVNFIVTEDAQHFLAELEYERQKFQFLDYEANVINTTGRLWGGEGSRIQVSRDRGRPLIITTDRKITEERFEKGEMAFKPSLVGFCTNIEPCDKITFTNILNVCTDCEKSVLDDRSLVQIQRGVNNLKRGQAMYAPDSPQYRQLATELNAIYETLNKRGLRDKMETII